ncbi:MAG: 3-dehydroquinate synthase [bacterium]
MNYNRTFIGKNLDAGKIVLRVVRSHTKRCLLITNTTVGKLHLKKVKRSLEKQGIKVLAAILPDGERYKNLYRVERLYKAALRARITRKCFAVALGGGVVGDTAGFFAATFLRGIDFIQIPTTLLAMVDASLGGKTGVDLPEGKNLVGAFKMPLAVIMDVKFLRTLPPREMKNGLAEVVKYGILNKSFFGFLEKNMDGIKKGSEKIILETIRKSAAIKMEIVKKDFRESGLRMILNLGHTIGHAIETLSGYGKMKHGEAVASGMIEEIMLSNFIKKCPEKVMVKAISLIIKAGFKRLKFNREKVLNLIQTDKKVIDKKPVFILIDGIGHPVPGEVPLNVLKQFYKHSGKQRCKYCF